MKTNKKIKIAYIINAINKTGPGNVVFNILTQLDHTKFEPILITLFIGNDIKVINDLKQIGVKVIECHNKSRIKFLIQNYKKLKKILANESIDIIHSHGIIPDFITVKFLKSKKRFTTIHNKMQDDYFYEYGAIIGFFMVKSHQKLLKKFDIVVGCSTYVYNSLLPFSNNICCIRNGINLESMNETITRKDLGIPEHAYVFLYVGRFIRRKNVIGLVKMFLRYHTDEEYLILTGDGPDFNYCKELADHHIIFTGFQKNPAKYYNISDIYISASKSEGFSISMIEALGYGLGLMVSDIPAHKEFFSIENKTYLGELFSTNTFEKKLLNLRLKRKLIEKEKIQYFQKNNLSAKIMTRQYEKIYCKYGDNI